MKIGDKLYCKHSFYAPNMIEIFKTGKPYIIIDKDELFVKLSGESDYSCHFQYKITQFRDKYFQLYDFFYTKNEITKIKLQNLTLI